MSSRHEVAIGASRFYIARFDAFTALEILGDLQQKFLGPVLASLEARGEGADADVTKALVAGLARLSGQIDGAALTVLARRLLNEECISVSIDNAEARKLDRTAVALSLTGADEIVQLCIEVVKVNYASFLARFGAALSGQGGSLLANLQSGSSARN